VDDGCTLKQLREHIASSLGVPVADQTLSLNQGLLLAKDPASFDHSLKSTRANDAKTIASLGVEHGSMVYCLYTVARDPTPTMAASHRSELRGGKMTVETMIAAQTRIERQESPACASVSVARLPADRFQRYVNGTLGFNQMRFGWMYGTVDETTAAVKVEAIYEPEQEGEADRFEVKEDTPEDRAAEAVAVSLGLRRVGCVFNVSVAKPREDFTLTAFELRTMAKYQAEYGEKFATVVVMMVEDEDEGTQVVFEPFQVSAQCARLYAEGWFSDEPSSAEGLTRLNKEVIVADKVSKDVTEVDNDRFLVTVPILDHDGSLRCGFPVENRLHPIQTTEDLADAVKNAGGGEAYAERLRDFHLLLFLAKHLDLNDLGVIASAAREGTEIQEGYKLIIDSIAGLA
jgi:nuclear protein localization family protein 4